MTTVTIEEALRLMATEPSEMRLAARKTVMLTAASVLTHLIALHGGKELTVSDEAGMDDLDCLKLVEKILQEK